MAITLVTGLPGHGKTLRVLSVLQPLAKSENRPVFHASGKPVEGSFGIPGLAIEGWQEHDPLQWFDLPPNSYMVIDECQRVFPIRARSSVVPKHVEQLETHRHDGIDLWLVTQHPMLIDTNVRKLVDRHFHVVRKFGTKFATVYEFPSGVQDSPEKNKQKNGVVRHEWRYPKNVFAWYKSAEVHTVKARLPAKVWMFLAFCLAVPLLIWLVYWRLYIHHGQAANTVAPGQAASAPGGGEYPSPGRPGRAVPPRLADALTAQEYLAVFRPRLPGLAFTAPAYDHLTKPVEAPYPSVCMFGHNADGEVMPCRCWSQRGFRLEVPDGVCRQLAREPMDPYWLRRGRMGFERGVGGQADGQQDAASAPAPVSTMPGQFVAQAGQQ